MLMLVLGALRAEAVVPNIAAAALGGHVREAIEMCAHWVERHAQGGAEQSTVVGQLQGQLLLATGRTEQAEAQFQQLLRQYDALSRQHVRWWSSIDRAMLQLVLQRPGRAAELFNITADDTAAPAALRVQALVGLACALHAVGEYRKADQALAVATEMAGAFSDARWAVVMSAVRADLAARRLLALESEQGPAAEQPALAGDRTQPLRAELRAALDAADGLPMVKERLRFLLALLSPLLPTAAGFSEVFDRLQWLSRCRLWELETAAHVEAALAYAAVGQVNSLSRLLEGIGADESQLRRSRHVVELKFCLSRLHALQGRHVDALRLYREHAREVLLRLRNELQLIPYSRTLDREAAGQGTDAQKMQLPPRYRKAYQFILDNLQDKDLSVHRIALHAGVTVRALQLAFRANLGLTPAELIRLRRVEQIRTELRQDTAHQGVLEVASHWGMGHRSTLGQNFRRFFNEAPGEARLGAPAS